MNVKQAAESIGCHPRTIQRALWAGDLRGHQVKKPRGHWRIRPSDLEKWAYGGNVTVTE
ncbi:ssDNA binding protein [Gordonia phage Dardanus]|uniref:SsDNA binding protein n=1 Tax=Gordonia phage Dardanus TaxID=2588489 RepID=A0A514CX35_9CAUD|nr:ssDNA binding protein [Gordonia phage Dardanus]QDH85075.1 ssDNA binding protein [Gordonia phage Dardanus]